MTHPDSQPFVGRIHGLRYERVERSERDVCIPPAFMITDEGGYMWSFGTEYAWHNGLMEFAVLRNDVDTGETASKIEYRGGVVTIWGHNGRRRWNGRTFI